MFWTIAENRFLSNFVGGVTHDLAIDETVAFLADFLCQVAAGRAV
jgi:hypothetical protein